MAPVIASSVDRYEVFVGRDIIDREFTDHDEAIEFAKSLEKTDSDDPNDRVQVDHFVVSGQYRSRQVVYPIAGPINGGFDLR